MKLSKTVVEKLLLEYLQTRKYSIPTIKHYQYALQVFYAYLNEIDKAEDLRNINRKILKNFIDYLYKYRSN